MMDPGPELTMVLLGNSGVGKSASGNTILDRKAFVSKRSFKAVTTQITHEAGVVFGKSIMVVDTPGIFGFEETLRALCQDLLQSGRPVLFLVVIKIDRFTIEQKNAVEKALSVIGAQGGRCCHLLFTGGDDLDGVTLKDFITSDPEGPLELVVRGFEDRLHVFNNESGGPEQVRELLLRSGHLRQAPAPAPAPVQEVRVVLLGLPGGGKSATGNTILGSDQFESGPSFNPVTMETVRGSAVVHNRRVIVVDTPGLSEKHLTPRDLFEEIVKSINVAPPGPHVFAIVVRIGRISPADILIYDLLVKFFGKESPKYAMVILTHGDELRAQSIDDLISKNKHMEKLVSTFGHRYCVFDNTNGGNRRQVQSFMSKVDEMVRANQGSYCHSNMFSTPPNDSLWNRLIEWLKNWLRDVASLIRSKAEETSMTTCMKSAMAGP